MPSPYIEAAATRAGIGYKSAPTPRTQQEAGIAHLQWEQRGAPIRRRWAVLGEAAVGVLLGIGILMLVL